MDSLRYTIDRIAVGPFEALRIIKDGPLLDGAGKIEEYFCVVSESQG